MQVPSIRQLFIALDIDKSKSLSATAKHFPMSQSAISQSVKRLEEIVGHELFQRTSSGVLLMNWGAFFCLVVSVLSIDCNSFRLYWMNQKNIILR